MCAMNIMHIVASQARTRNAKRRLYNTELNLQVVAACAHPGASMTGVALQFDIKFDNVQYERKQRGGGRPYDLRSTGSSVVRKKGLR
jgi:transposase-like protein